MESRFELEGIDALIRRVFQIEDITTGSEQSNFIARYRGRLISEDSASAYDSLKNQFAPYGLTPLFRWDEDRHAIFLVPGRPRPKASNPVVNLVLFILTILSVAFVGIQGDIPAPTGGASAMLVYIGKLLWSGAPYAASLLAILSAHEFGHYLMGRHHGVHVTLPYFIPMPFTLLGTMGAFINMKETPKNRRQLLDIGLAGPLAGLIVAIPVLLFGLSLSKVEALPTQVPAGTSFLMEGNSLLYLALKYISFNQLLPAPITYDGLPGWMYWLRFFFTGQPYPSGGLDVMLHPVAWAGWVGILVTALNLIPAGQLDGGHILYVLVGRKRATFLLPVVLITIAALGFVWSGWWLWAALIFFLGRTYAEPLDQITPLDGQRKMLAALAIVIFFLVFTPVPFNIVGGF